LGVVDGDSGILGRFWLAVCSTPAFGIVGILDAFTGVVDEFEAVDPVELRRRTEVGILDDKRLGGLEGRASTSVADPSVGSLST